MNINVRPSSRACRGGVRQFRKQGGGGVIINVGSVAGRTGGGIGCRSMPAPRLSSQPSRARSPRKSPLTASASTCVAGVIATDMQDRVSTPAQIAATGDLDSDGSRRERRDCVGRFSNLWQRRSKRYVTGQVLEVNGGLVMP